MPNLTGSAQIGRIAALLEGVGASCELELPGGQVVAVGAGPADFRVVFERPWSTSVPLDERSVGRAYVEGDIDLQGDMMAAFDVRERLRARVPPAQLLRFAAQMALASPIRANRRAIGHHYTHGDDFYLSFIDTRYRLYSQCLFESDDESLEDAAERKLESVWSALDLRPGLRVLDIGGGWGGLTEYCGRRGVHVTSLTLADDSAAHIRGLIRDHGLPGEVRVEDMLVHRPAQPYDHAVICGVIEHIPTYRRFCQRLWEVLAPGGRLYLDASASKEKYAMSAFARQYIWKGTHSFMAVQDVIEELLFHGFEVVGLRRETHDYELTMRHWARRLDESRDTIVERWGEPLYRAFRLYLWGGAHSLMTNRIQAYSVVAERRPDRGPRPGNTRRFGHFVLSLR